MKIKTVISVYEHILVNINMLNQHVKTNSTISNL